MSNLDLQFEEFMKEPLSTDESPDSNSGLQQSTNVKESFPEPREFWWLKGRPQKEKMSVETTSHRSPFSGTSDDSPLVEEAYATVSPTMRNMGASRVLGSASPDISSSMAEFLEKEKLCKELSSSISEADSPGLDLDYPGGDVTDDDIGSIMEQLSQLAGSGDDSAAEKSVEEILKEAEELVRETSHTFSGLSDTSNLLRAPVTSGLIIKGRSASHIPSTTTSKKKDLPDYMTSKEKRKNDENISRKALSTPRSSRKITSKSPSREKLDKSDRYSFTRTSSLRTTLKKSDNKSFETEIKSSDNFKARTSSQNSGRRVDSRVENKTNRMSMEDLALSYSSDFNKIKDLSKKEKTVTFEESYSLYPEPKEQVDKIHTVQISSQILPKEHERKSNMNPNRVEGVLERTTPQMEDADSYSLLEDRNDGQLTEVISVSPPLIQHGDMLGAPEAIFQLIDNEVRNEIVAALEESKSASSQHENEPSLSIEKDREKIFGPDDNMGNEASDSLDGAGFSFPSKRLSVVREESSVSDTSLDIDKFKDAVTMTELLCGKDFSDKCVQVRDDSTDEDMTSLKNELLEERKKLLKLKSELDAEEQEYKKQLDALKCKHEEEIFNLKKDIYVLNAKIADFEKQENVMVEKGGGDCKIDDGGVKVHRIVLLETELQQQEQLMQGYQRENMKLCQDMKQLKEELKVKEQNFALERQQLSSARQREDVERLYEKLKDKDETIVRLQIEVQTLRDKNGDLEHMSEELKLSNKTLKAEAEKHKHAASKVPVPQSKTTPRKQDLERLKEELLKKEGELAEIRKELQTTQTEVTIAKAEASDWELQVGCLETKISELQSSLSKERAQTRAQNVRIEEDKKKIQDLTRQVKEMERILKRNHPNSISALILTANSEGTDPTSAPTPRVKYLENRAQQLEQELAKSEADAQTSIKEIQDKFQSMKVKYEEHTSDLELQLATAKHQAHMWRQAAEKNEAKMMEEKRLEEQPVREMKQSKKMAAPPPMVIAVGPPSANALAVREDAHLLATIRGLKLELASKDKELMKLRKDLDESNKTNRRLQRERERQLGIVATPSRAPAVRGATKEEQSSETEERQNNRVYDSVRPEPEQKEGISRLEQENGMLRQEMLRLEEDYRGLQTKRLQDLNVLQEQHEAELDRLISDHAARHSSSRIADLQSQLCTQQIIIGHLKEQLKKMEEYREEAEMLRAERDHLEKSNMDLRKKLAELRSMQTPEMVQYETLQEKLSELERRHEAREQKLQAMVRDLLRRNAEQRALNGEDSNATTMREKLLDKNRQLCLYRAEIDRILDTLREFNRHKRNGSSVQQAPD
ncbi:centrosomal protein of 162 kDa [Periplaneta americana]|uniref:centrosomal protein of 162 kDa n=1 Tax=Periplaneta americana TaxID=6978 RepID=UPI0037E8D405